MSDVCRAIMSHYQRIWHGPCLRRQWLHGSIGDLPQDFCVLEFAPSASRNRWTYATCGMSYSTNTIEGGLELHLFSPRQDECLVELLTVVAHYHLTGSSLALGHTVNFGRPWLPGSICDKGLISLPYLDGPCLENLQCGSRPVRCLWLVPITGAEVEYAKKHGLDALETKFELASVDYADPMRASLI